MITGNIYMEAKNIVFRVNLYEDKVVSYSQHCIHSTLYRQFDKTVSTCDHTIRCITMWCDGVLLTDHSWFSSWSIDLLTTTE